MNAETLLLEEEASPSVSPAAAAAVRGEREGGSVVLAQEGRRREGREGLRVAFEIRVEREEQGETCVRVCVGVGEELRYICVRM